MIWWCRSEPINFSMHYSQITDLNLTLWLIYSDHWFPFSKPFIFISFIRCRLRRWHRVIWIRSLSKRWSCFSREARSRIFSWNRCMMKWCLREERKPPSSRYQLPLALCKLVSKSLAQLWSHRPNEHFSSNCLKQVQYSPALTFRVWLVTDIIIVCFHKISTDSDTTRPCV